jgi:Cu(I)/Ag(I) efflux system protein CusF
MKQTAILPLISALFVSSLGFAQAANANDMSGKHASKESKAAVHQTDAVVKKINPASGKVTLAHGPVKSLNWPAMTMSFSVHDDALFDKLAVDKKVNVGFIKNGSDYVVTAVK